jgi:hypothetical protein
MNEILVMRRNDAQQMNKEHLPYSELKLVQ